MPKKLTCEQFIEKAKEVHGNKYDYSKVNYVNTDTKICIICPEHGEFWQTPYKHLSRKQGCPKCANKHAGEYHKLTTEQFIEKAKIVHGNKYDYSNIKYTNSHTKVCIICPEHGEFWQRPNGHLNGKGCSKCAGKNKTTEEFIKEAIKLQGLKYDYSKIKYINATTKVCIICPEHGEFWQTPNDHLMNKGCPKCGNMIIANRLSFDDFIKKANKVHNNKYDYSKTNYIDTKTKICIICPKHGEFWQTPEKHMRGQGCPKCNSSKLENSMRNILISKHIKYIEQYNNLFLGLQRLDFYLPDYKVGIECQGEQHFIPVDFANNGEEWSKNLYIKNLKRDKIKNDKCNKNGIKLLYFTSEKNSKLINGNKLYNKNNLFIDENKLLEEIIKNS